MNKRSLFVLPILLLGLTLAHAKSIPSGMDTLINTIDQTINIGIEVIDLHTNRILYQRNPNRAFIPASNMKLFSDAAALMVLGPDYRFKNQLSMKGSSIENHRLHGDIILHLPGDPSFGHQQLSHLFQSLSQWQIHRIDGDIIIDSQLGFVTPYATGRMKEDQDYAYGAPLAPLMLEQNRILITVNPAGHSGKPAIIEHNAPYQTFTIINNVQTQKKGKACGVAFKMDENNTLTVSGCVQRGQWAVMQNLALQNPLLHLQQSIQAILQQHNIQLNGTIHLGKAPARSFLLSNVDSSPISQLIIDTMKSSDNLYADALFLHAAASLNNKSVDWPQAQPLIKRFLHKETGIDLQHAVLTDGSGLSRHNRLTAAQTVELLQFLHHHFALTYEYIAALPVSGRDGTLQKRLRKPNQRDRVRAKTGTMRGILSLSGFLETTNGHTLAFAIYINTLPGTPATITQRYRYLIDAICRYFLQQTPIQPKALTVKSTVKTLRFQKQLSQAEHQQRRAARWRKLELQIKKIAQKEGLTVLFRPQELIIRDSLSSASILASNLQQLYTRTPFALALNSQEPLKSGYPLPILWQKSTGPLPEGIQRLWIIRSLAESSKASITAPHG